MDFQNLNNWIQSHHCCLHKLAVVVEVVEKVHVQETVEDEMPLEVGERLLAELRQHDLKVVEHSVATGTLDHHMSPLWGPGEEDHSNPQVHGAFSFFSCSK